MGQFSWLDCVTKEQILDDEIRDVYVLVPQEFGGGHIKEKCYDGYGRFGGHDIYDLVVDWNKGYLGDILAHADTWRCRRYIDGYISDFKRLQEGKEPQTEKRILGIALACYDEDNVRLRYPIKITYDKNAVYEYCAPSMTDPNQGWRMV